MNVLRKIAILAVALCAAAQLVAAQGKGQSQTDEPPACVLADKALAQKQPDLAAIEYEKCLSTNPPSFRALSNLGIAYAQQQKFTQAIQAYGQALALDPQYDDIARHVRALTREVEGQGI